ncbi:MAG TPA: hypothetical protein VGE38_04865 [Nocardioides sp.]
MTCHAHLGGFPDGLTCTRTDAHDRGHTYESTSAGDAERAEGDS